MKGWLAMLKINSVEKVITLLFLGVLTLVGIEIYNNFSILDVGYFIIMLICFCKFLYLWLKK